MRKQSCLLWWNLLIPLISSSISSIRSGSICSGQCDGRRWWRYGGSSLVPVLLACGCLPGGMWQWLWLLSPALRQLRRGEVMDLMIQMKSLNYFMDDTNDTLNEFTVAVNVWCDDYGGWCVAHAWLRGEVMWREEVAFRSLTEGMEVQEKVSFRTSGQTTSKWPKPQMTISDE